MWYGQAERGLLPGRHHFLVWSPLEQIKLQWCASPGDHIGTRNLYCIYTQRLAWRNRACLLSGDIMWSHTDLWSWITRFINLRVFLWNHSQNWCTFLLNENRSQGNVNLLTACVPYSWWDWEILVLSAVTELQEYLNWELWRRMCWYQDWFHRQQVIAHWSRCCSQGRLWLFCEFEVSIGVSVRQVVLLGSSRHGVQNYQVI